jgi:hypothetical protein
MTFYKSTPVIFGHFVKSNLTLKDPEKNIPKYLLNMPMKNF